MASQGLTGGRQRRGATQDKSPQAGKLVAGVDIELIQPLLKVMTELASSGGGERELAGNESGLEHPVNGEESSSERETDILDDVDEADDVAGPALDMPCSSSVCSLSSENLPETQRPAQTEYSTDSWVRQQQMVDVTDNCLTADMEVRSSRVRNKRPVLAVPDTPPRGLSSRDAVLRGQVDQDDAHNIHNTQTDKTTHTPPCQEDELATLTTDIDESIEQLNRLILDLDPTFVPVPTRCAPLSRSVSLHTNGHSHKGNTHLSGKFKPG